jgi:16S rRNA (cytosine967-C5)-methyltransferase
LSLSPARLAAFRILLRVLCEDAYATELLHSRLSNSLSEKDRRLSTELVFGVLRQQALLDHLLAQNSNTPLSKLDPEVVVALRLGAYQVLFLARVPSRAAIHESVELVKQAKLKSAAGYVNAVLRRVNREDIEPALSAFGAESPAGLSLRHSHPQWLVERWERRYGREKLLALLQYDNRPPRLCFRVNSPNLAPDGMIAELEQEEISVRTHPLAQEIFEVVGGNLYETSLFRNHQIAVQDAGSQLIPYLLELQPGDTCLDLCAGPGGKSSQIARLRKSPTAVIAADLHLHRLRVARELHSEQWKNLRWVVVDGTHPLPFKQSFDKILLDAPCSGTGTLQRHPEIRWRLKPESLEALVALQLALLENALHSLKPGGTLVYSTCSLEPEENEAVIDSFLARHPDVRLILPEDATLRGLFDAQRFFRLFPPESNSDGFFAAVLRRP